MTTKPGTLLAALCIAAVAIAGEAKKPVKLNPRIAALADNTWIKMNPEKEPAGRNYSGCALGYWNGGAKVFYFGGAHFSYAYDDAAVYDVAGNAWKSTWEDRREWVKRLGAAKKLTDEDARKKATGKLWKEAVDDGRLPPTHTYQQMCWIPEKKAVFYLGWSGTWIFSPEKNRWRCVTLPVYSHYEGMDEKLGRKAPWTRWAVQTHHCYYSPVAKAPVAITTHRPQGDWLFDVEKEEWQSLKRSIGSMGGEIYSTYVP
ncbi:MAG: hypothetical protein ACYTGB_03235, partial [Planctomycetota bacterium]